MDRDSYVKSSNFSMDESKHPGSDCQIDVAFESVGNHPFFCEQLRKIKSPYIYGAVDSFVGGISLLRNALFGQSFILLFQTLETSLKCFLDHLHRIGEAQFWANKKDLIRLAAGQKRASYSSDLMDKNHEELKFFQVFGIVNEKLAFECEFDIEKITKIRNKIIHLGLNESRERECIQHLFQTLIPLLEELFLKGFDACLSDKIFARVARELVVVARVARLSNYDQLAIIYSLATLRSAMNPRDHNEQHTAHWLEETFEQSDGGYPLPGTIRCKICAGEAHGVTDGILQNDESNEYFELTELYCPNCELELRPTYLDERDQEQEFVTALLRIHYGRITPFNLSPLRWKKLKEITGNQDVS